MGTKIEVELRALLKDRATVEQTLKARGARLVYCTQLTDHWFCRKDATKPDDALVNNSGFALRIRETWDPYSERVRASLDCKTLCDGTNHAFCKEFELNLDEPEQMKAILDAIGLKEYLLIEKERIMYTLDGVKYCFDDLKGVGEGIEIETNAEGDLQAEYQKLVDLAHGLGIGDDEILEKTLTYIAMQKLSKF